MLFAVIPVILGAVAVWCTRARTTAQAVWAGMIANGWVQGFYFWREKRE
jgi:hypothetical protein